LISCDGAFAPLCRCCGRESKIVMSERGLAAAVTRAEEAADNPAEEEIAD